MVASAIYHHHFLGCLVCVNSELMASLFGLAHTGADRGGGGGGEWGGGGVAVCVSDAGEW